MQQTTSAPVITHLKARRYSSKSIGEKETEQITRLSQGGFYPHEIAGVTGRSTGQIELCLWEAGFTPRSHAYKTNDVIAWVKCYTGEFDGIPMSFAEIARQSGYGPVTIQLAVLRAGIRDRHRSETLRYVYERKRRDRKH